MHKPAERRCSYCGDLFLADCPDQDDPVDFTCWDCFGRHFPLLAEQEFTLRMPTEGQQAWLRCLPFMRPLR